MDKEKSSLQSLINTYLEGKCSREEERLLMSWIRQYQEVDEIKLPDESRGKRMKEQIDLINQAEAKKGKLFPWFLPMRYAAAGIAMMVGVWATWFYFGRMKDEKAVAPVVAVTERLPDFSRIRNTTSEPKVWSLSDGSKVHLQAGAELIYPATFGTDGRQVELEGKAFFEVAKDLQRPFTVVSGKISTTALGTSFWVEHPSDGNTSEVRLITGRVVIKSRSASKETTLAYLDPGQRLHYDNGTDKALVGRFDIKKKAKKYIEKSGEAKSVHIPKDRQLVFDNTPLNEALERLQSHYQVEIQYDREEMKDMTFYGEFNEKDKIADILTIISTANSLNLEATQTGFMITK